MNLKEYRSKEARNLAKLVGIAFEAGKITEETREAGLFVSTDIETAHREGSNLHKVIAEAAAERRRAFNDLFERDTSGNGVEPRGAA